MKGIRKRVLVSFVSVVTLLFFAGIVSLMELNRVSTDTEEILRASERNLELANDMLDAIARQNKAVIHALILGQTQYDGELEESLLQFERSLATAREEALDETYLDSLREAAGTLRLVTEEFRLQRTADRGRRSLAYGLGTEEDRLRSDSLAAARMRQDGVAWYDARYGEAYERVTHAVKNYMLSTQSSLAPRAELLKKNAYRAVTPVLISLLVMILIVLLLGYFVMIYLVEPLLAMNRGLAESLRFRIPFRVKAELKDEVNELKEQIDGLLQRLSALNDRKP